jgi:hypothetical protein
MYYGLVSEIKYYYYYYYYYYREGPLLRVLYWGPLLGVLYRGCPLSRGSFKERMSLIEWVLYNIMIEIFYFGNKSIYSTYYNIKINPFLN